MLIYIVVSLQHILHLASCTNRLVFLGLSQKALSQLLVQIQLCPLGVFQQRHCHCSHSYFLFPPTSRDRA